MSFKPQPILAFVLALTAGMLPAAAQSVFWQPAGGQLGVGKSSELRLVFENCRPSGSFILPDVPALNFGRPSRANEMSADTIGGFVRRDVFIYHVQPRAEGTIIIPSFDVETSIGTMTVAEARFEAGQASIGQSNVSISDIFISQLRTGKTEVWEGEVIEIEYVIVGSGRYRWDRASEPHWEPSGLIVEPFGNAEQVQATVADDRFWGFRHRTRAIATRSGTLDLPPVRQIVNVQTGERSMFSIFSQPRYERFTVESESTSLVVNPLPDPAPPDFVGAVGSFDLASTIVPETVRVGEPVTWTLALSGTGNWPVSLHLPEREVSADFEVVQPRSRQAMDDNSLFSGALSEDAVLIPTRAGTYEIGPVGFSFFDPASGVYRSETIPATTVVIDPPAVGGIGAILPPDSGQEHLPRRADDHSPTFQEPPVVAPSLPQDVVSTGGVLRDPLNVPAIGTAPLPVSYSWWSALALLPPALAWVLLAWRQMLAHDPARERRQARRQLVRELESLAASNRQPDEEAVVRWRLLTRKTWGISEATPDATTIARHVSKSNGDGAADGWSTLWRESESFLFGTAQTLQDDWTQRALETARRASIERTEPPIPLKTRHWNPRMAALLVVLAASSGTDGLAIDARPSDPRALYHQGSYDSARETWLELLAVEPRDWAVRNNIALTHAQQGDWSRAAAYWTSAMLLHPGDESVRSNLSLALAHTQGVDPLVRRLFGTGSIDRAAATLAPGRWHQLFYLGAAVVAAGLLLAVVSLYRARNSRPLRLTGYSFAMAGVILSTAALAALDRYGILAQSTAAIISVPSELRSIPTDLAESQQTTPIAAGTVVNVRRPFLDWAQVQTANGTIGWIRQGNYTPIYESPSTTSSATFD